MAEIINPVDTADGIAKECIDLMRKKNHDYAGPQDFFKNLTYCEKLGICSTQQGMLVRMSDKMSRLSTLIGSGEAAQVKDESIDDTLRDMVNYSLLMLTYRKHLRMGEPAKP